MEDSVRAKKLTAEIVLLLADEPGDVYCTVLSAAESTLTLLDRGKETGPTQSHNEKILTAIGQLAETGRQRVRNKDIKNKLSLVDARKIAISSRLIELEKKGLLERVGTDAKRGHTYELTAKGLASLDSSQPAA